MASHEAMRVIGGMLSQTSKMPGYSYNIPAADCIIGARLRKIPGSVCNKCYALRGRYTFPVVQRAMKRHLQAIKHPDWVEAMAVMINWWCQEIPYFRWHDSGDLQGVWHLRKINDIAVLTPFVCHWIPTRETKITKTFVANFELAPNLILRLSDAMISESAFLGRMATREKYLTSGVAPSSFKKKWLQLVKTNNNRVFHCPASIQGGRCMRCRACWNSEVQHVVYPQK